MRAGKTSQLLAVNVCCRSYEGCYRWHACKVDGSEH